MMCMAPVESSKSLPEILNKFALTQNELNIYFHLVNNGPKPAKFLAVGFVDALVVLIDTELNRLAELQLMKDTVSKVNFSKTSSLI